MAEKPQSTLQQLIEDTPPNTWVRLTDGVRIGSNTSFIEQPEVWFWCRTCGAFMLHKCTSSTNYLNEPMNDEWMKYTCKHCEKGFHWLALAVTVDGESK